MSSRTASVFFLAATLGLTSANAAITFTLSFTAQAQSDLSPSEQALFTDAIQFWDDLIDGHRDAPDLPVRFPARGSKPQQRHDDKRPGGRCACRGGQFGELPSGTACHR